MKSTLLAVILLLAAEANAAEPSASWADQWRSANEVQIVRQLADFTAIPSIASNPAGLRAMADRLRAALAERGFQARLLEGGQDVPPVVFAEFKTPGARRTVVFYAHYDGQPVVPSEWHSGPFEPLLRKGATLDSAAADLGKLVQPINPEWRLYGRAASDDKSSIVAFLSAWDAMKATGRRPSINVKVYWEGEEEVGSPHLTRVLEQNRSALASDLWLIGDATWHQSRLPTIYFGARGVITAQFKVYGPRRPLHSGYYGNWAPNPAYRIAELIAGLRKADGSINIAGFDEDVVPLRPTERQAIADLPSVDAELKADAGIAASESDDSVIASTMRPAMNIRGLRAGGSVGAIPDVAEAFVDFRLVPAQTPERVRQQVEAHLRSLGWKIVEGDPDETTRRAHRKILRVDWGSGYPAYRSDMTSAVSRAVLKTARDANGGRVAVLPMIGGSVPIYLIDKTFDVPVIGFPFQNHDNNQHAADENARLGNLWEGIDTYAAMLTQLNW